MSSEDSTQGTAPRRLTLLFVVALIFSLATFLLEVAFSFFLPRFMESSLGGGGAIFIEYYALLQSFALFLINPVFGFLIFYKLSSVISVRISSDYLGILTYSFAGGFVGLAIGDLGFVVYQVTANGYNAIGPFTNWFLWSAQFLLGLVREGISTAILALAAIVVGRLRSDVHMAKPSISPPSSGDPVQLSPKQS